MIHMRSNSTRHTLMNQIKRSLLSIFLESFEINLYTNIFYCEEIKFELKRLNDLEHDF